MVLCPGEHVYICSIGDRDRARARQVQNTGNRSLFYQCRQYPKHKLKLILGLIRPKQKFLGLRLAFMNV